MTTKTSDKIISFLEKNSPATPKEIVDYLGITKQAVFRHLSRLIKNQIILKNGKPPKVFYFINIKKDKTFVINDTSCKTSADNITPERNTGKINMQTNLTNKFFDINKFPAIEGMLVFPISMSRISNESQNAKKYWEYIQFIKKAVIFFI